MLSYSDVLWLGSTGLTISRMCVCVYCSCVKRLWCHHCCGAVSIFDIAECWQSKHTACAQLALAHFLATVVIVS